MGGSYFLTDVEKREAASRPLYKTAMDKVASRLHVKDAWFTFGLLLGLQLIVSSSVQGSHWVLPSPRLWLLTILASLLGAGLSRLKRPIWMVLGVHLLGLCLGLGFALFETANTVPGPSLVGRSQAMFERLGAWVNAATSGGISNDRLPFALFLSVLAWMIAYLSSWIVFRFRLGWGGILPPALALLSNMTYLPDSRRPLSLFFFLLLSMMLMAQLSLSEQRSLWARENMSQRFGWRTLAASTFALSLLVLLVAWATPVERAVISPLKASYSFARGPWADAEQQFDRLFAGIPSQKAGRLHSFGAAMPLRGSAGRGDQILFTVTTEYPGYWKAQSYDIYIGQGWTTSQGLRQPAVAQTSKSQPQDYPKREKVAQRVGLMSPGDVLFATGQPLEVSIPAFMVVSRTAPQPSDVLSLRAPGELKASTTYDVVSSVSIATADDLRKASADYPKWVTDQYLQLPNGLPPRVRSLALDIAGPASTPFDKASAIQDYLHGFQKDLDINPPLTTADAVDYFLFESKSGYSDYFASAMVVMARAAGIPSRLATGYLTGQLDDQSKSFVVREADAHSWTEVYFPGYGWIEFEPSPGLPDIPRGELPTRVVPTDITDGSSNIEDFFDEFALEPDPGSLNIDIGPPPSPIIQMLKYIGLGAGVAAGAILALMLLIALMVASTWQLSFAGLPYAHGIYERMCRLGSFALSGPRPSDTPGEFAQELGRAFPNSAQEAAVIANGYTKARYSTVRLSGAERGDIERAWRKMRGPLLRQAVNRWKRLLSKKTAKPGA